MNIYSRMPRRLTTVTLLTMALCSANARAHESDAPVFSFRGFGTLGVVYSSEDKADFTSSVLKPNGAGHSRAWSADVDSLIGGQVTANFTPSLAAVLQLIAEQNYDNSYRPHVEWANIQYQFTPEFSARVGRTVLPTFLLSDTRKVAYTYPWVRPPLEVYRLVPVTASDGVDIRYRVHVGDVTHSLQANYGKSAQTLPDDGGTLEAKQAWGLTYSADYGAANMHVAYQRPHLTLDTVAPLFDAFRLFGAEGAALADNYDLDDMPLSIIAAGAAYDPGDWFAMAEWSHTEIQSFIGDRTGWYVSGGYRFGKFTPYLSYAQARADNLSDPGLNLSGLPPALAGTAAGLNAGLNALLAKKTVQDTLSIGGRWELTRNSAVKLQYDRTRIGDGSPGVLVNTQPDFQPGGEINVISATIDFVF